MFPKGPSSPPARSKREMHECLWKTRRGFFPYTMGFIYTPKTTKPLLHKSDHPAVSEVRDVICLDSYEMSGKKGEKECSPVCKSERKPVLLTLALAQKVGV